MFHPYQQKKLSFQRAFFNWFWFLVFLLQLYPCGAILGLKLKNAFHSLKVPAT
jgi:hypothetical protein